ncbi:TetR/AcrR family transcriptional regulator [Pedobacter heparinus]|uniref:TetR/AcrR family transcriptional regulator n=1 Tax=Pedobacter heparinus TaxID=984 RepID=UPI002930588E|nr:TetR/AcrR family transcriptional regulator [Pedobacter heparinus]
MTKRKEYKERDADEAIRKLLEATGKIVREEGFEAITSTKVARMIGMDPGVVNKRFGNLNGLKEAYIKTKDYWVFCFEQYMLPEGARDEEILEMFTGMMLSSYDFFAADGEMQSIIWSQTGVGNNPLLRRLSEEREAGGAPLLALTDRHFADGPVDFRFVACAIVGASYYPVWHARNNKSTVAGIDINLEQHYKGYRNILAYLMELAWNDAGRSYTEKPFYGKYLPLT